MSDKSSSDDEDDGLNPAMTKEQKREFRRIDAEREKREKEGYDPMFSGFNYRREDDKAKAYLQEYSLRKDRYMQRLRYGRGRPFYAFSLEKLCNKYRRGLITREEYEKGRLELRDFISYKGFRSYDFDHYHMLHQLVAFKREAVFDRDMDCPHTRIPRRYREEQLRKLIESGSSGSLDMNSDSEDEVERTPEKFKEHEKALHDWHNGLSAGKFSVQYGTKKIVSDQVFLQNEYNVDRYVGMVKELREPVFLTKMAYNSVSSRAPGVLKALLKYGAWVNQPNTFPEEHNCTALHLACSTAERSCVEVLIFGRSDVDVVEEFGNSCPLLAMHSGSCSEIMKLLYIRSKAPLVWHINHKKQTLFHGCGPFFTRRDDYRNKPPKFRENNEAYEYMLQKAKESGELETLLYKHARDAQGFTAAHDAAYAGSGKNIKLLAKYGAPMDWRCLELGDTPLHYSVELGHLECTRNLLEAGVAINAPNGIGKSCLQMALKNFLEHDPSPKLQQQPETYPQEIVALLLEHGAHVHEVYNRRTGASAFHFAVQRGQRDLVKMFLEYGASSFVTDKSGHRAMELRYYHQEYLTEASSRVRSLVEVCKWKIRESIDVNFEGTLQKAVKLLPIPLHLQTYLVTRGFAKPSFTRAATDDEEEEPMET